MFNEIHMHERLITERRASGVYTVESWRWVNLACYCGSMVGTATIKYGFSPIALTVSTVYDVQTLTVNFGVICFFIGYIVANFPSIYFLNKGSKPGEGIYWSMKICSFVQVCCVWGRYLALLLTDNFYVLMIFQCISALVYPFFQNSFSRIATLWFGENERTLAATVGAMSYGGGTFIGLLLGPFFVLDSDREEGHMELGKEHVRTLMLVAAVLVTVICLPTLVIFRRAPKNFPSPSAEHSAMAL